MEALLNLIEHIPEWIRRLDDLSGQIEQRQIELAALGASTAAAASPDANGTNGAAKSLKNKGSTESLKPRDEPDAFPVEPDAAPRSKTPPQNQKNEKVPVPSSPAESKTPSGVQRQAAAMQAAGQAGKTRARAVIHKKQRTESMISNVEGAPKYRSRSIIIVYYDSYVQTFFEDLVKFVSASRNMMRKAKMAAKVAQIRKMAEMELPDEDEDENEVASAPNGVVVGNTVLAAAQVNGTPGSGPVLPSALAADTASTEAAPAKEGEQELPPMRYVSSRRMQPVSRTPNMLMMSSGRPLFSRSGIGRGADNQPDIYDQLDKGLGYVQGMCEHAAHQFLRDGDCVEEVGNIERRLGETKELADKEMNRVKREEPDSLKVAEEEPSTGRVHRPLKMAREAKSPKENVVPGTGKPPAINDMKQYMAVDSKLEVDEGIDDMEEMPIPNLMYRSTRAMR